MDEGELAPSGGLDERALLPTWREQFELWFSEAGGRVGEPEAMVLGTADGAGRPSARTVLLKAVDDRGFVFYSNRTSRKGRDLQENPRASLVFPWYPLHRQVVVAGTVEQVSEEESDAYYASRDHESRLGAHASRQSSVIGSRAELERAVEEARSRWPVGSEVPRPPWWGGYRVLPETVEFWHGRASRLHDRLRFRAADGGWVTERLSP